MATKDKKNVELLDKTIAVLGGDLSATSPEEGIDLIQQWIGVVKGNPSTMWLAETLEKLQTAIQENSAHEQATKVNEIEGLMADMSGITIDFANNAATGHYKEELQNLSTVLKDFAQQLSNPAH